MEMRRHDTYPPYPFHVGLQCALSVFGKARFRLTTNLPAKSRKVPALSVLHPPHLCPASPPRSGGLYFPISISRSKARLSMAIRRPCASPSPEGRHCIALSCICVAVIVCNGLLPAWSAIFCLSVLQVGGPPGLELLPSRPCQPCKRDQTLPSHRTLCYKCAVSRRPPHGDANRAPVK